MDQQLSKLQELRVKRSSPSSGSRDTYSDLKNRIQQRLIAELDPGMDLTQTTEVRATIQEMFGTMLHDEQIVLTRNEKKKLFESIVAEILGYGPLEQYLNLDSITEIMVNGPKNIYIERTGRIEHVDRPIAGHVDPVLRADRHGAASLHLGRDRFESLVVDQRGVDLAVGVDPVVEGRGKPASAVAGAVDSPHGDQADYHGGQDKGNDPQVGRDDGGAVVHVDVPRLGIAWGGCELYFFDTSMQVIRVRSRRMSLPPTSAMGPQASWASSIA